MADRITKIDKVLSFLGLLVSKVRSNSKCCDCHDSEFDEGGYDYGSENFGRNFETFQVLRAGVSAGFNQFTDALVDEERAITEKLYKQEEKIVKNGEDPNDYEIVLGKWNYAVMSDYSYPLASDSLDDKGDIKKWFGKAGTYAVVRDSNWEQFCFLLRKEK